MCYAENVAYVVESGKDHIVSIDLGKKASRKGDSRNAQNLCIDSSTDLTALAHGALHYCQTLIDIRMIRKFCLKMQILPI